MTNEEWYGCKIYSGQKNDGDMEELENKKDRDPVFKDKIGGLATKQDLQEKMGFYKEENDVLKYGIKESLVSCQLEFIYRPVLDAAYHAFSFSSDIIHTGRIYKY